MSRNILMLALLGVGGYVLYQWLKTQSQLLPVPNYTPLVATPGAVGPNINAGPAPISQADITRMTLLAQGYTELPNGTMVPPGGIS